MPLETVHVPLVPPPIRPISLARRAGSRSEQHRLDDAVIRERYAAWTSSMANERVGSPGRSVGRNPSPSPGPVLKVTSVVERAPSSGIKPTAAAATQSVQSSIRLSSVREPLEPLKSTIMARSQAGVVSLRRRLCTSFHDLCATSDRLLLRLDTEFGDTSSAFVRQQPQPSCVAPMSLEGADVATAGSSMLRPGIEAIGGPPAAAETRWSPPVADAVRTDAAPGARITKRRVKQKRDSSETLSSLALHNVPERLASELNRKLAAARVRYNNKPAAAVSTEDVPHVKEREARYAMVCSSRHRIHAKLITECLPCADAAAGHGASQILVRPRGPWQRRSCRSNIGFNDVPALRRLARLPRFVPARAFE